MTIRFEKPSDQSHQEDSFKATIDHRLFQLINKEVLKKKRQVTGVWFNLYKLGELIGASSDQVRHFAMRHAGLFEPIPTTESKRKIAGMYRFTKAYPTAQLVREVMVIEETIPEETIGRTNEYHPYPVQALGYPYLRRHNDMKVDKKPKS